jgi:hypothetical protein
MKGERIKLRGFRGDTSWVWKMRNRIVIEYKNIKMMKKMIVYDEGDDFMILGKVWCRKYKANFDWGEDDVNITEKDIKIMIKKRGKASR